MKMKLKTSKSASKRFKFSSHGKIRRRSAGTNHFNARENSGAIRTKRSIKDLAHSNIREIKNLLPYIKHPGIKHN